MTDIIMDVGGFLDIIGDADLVPEEQERLHNVRAGPNGEVLGDAIRYDLTDKSGETVDSVWVYVPVKYAKSAEIENRSDEAGTKADPHFGQITELYFMSYDHGKPPKVSQWSDPALTIMSMKNLAIDPETFVASMSDDDSFARYDYGVSLFNGNIHIQDGKSSDQYIEVGKGGKATVDAGAGDDTLHVWHRKTVDFDGGSGHDTLAFTQAIGRIDDLASVGATVDLGKGTATNPWGGTIKLTSVENVTGFYGAADTLIGSTGANTIVSGHYGDTLKGLNGNDIITVESYFGSSDVARNLHADGGKGTDTLLIQGIAAQGNTLDLEHPGNNTGSFVGSTVRNFEIYRADFDGTALTFHGSEGGEKVLMYPSENTDDVLDGRGGDDLLYGSAGTDTLTGGTGADQFQFRSIDDSITSAPDTITDFSHADHDRIDLSNMYGGTLHFIGARALNGHAGQVHAVTEGGQTLVEVDVDGDMTADFALLRDGAPHLVKGDFML